MLGLTVQYLHNDMMKSVTLGITELSATHSSANIKIAIIDCLEKYGLQLFQVIALGTDNASNLTALGRLFSLQNGDEDSNEEMNDYNDEIYQLEFDSFPNTSVYSDGDIDQVCY